MLFFLVAAFAEAACDGLAQGTCGSTAGCEWCTSAAVGANCYTEEDAKSLPSAVFSCGALLGAASCDGLSEGSCESTSGCEWCTSAAVPSACHTEADAKALPPAVFFCSSKEVLV